MGDIEYEYRVYTVDNAGRIAGAKDFKCRGDEDARGRVQAMLGTQILELWRGVAFLGRFDPRYRPAG